VKPQHTYETCLAWSLLHLAGETSTLEKELELLLHSLKFTKKDFTIGHLEAVKDKFEKIDLYIDSEFRYECNSTAQLRKAKNISIHPCNVPAMVLDLFLDNEKALPLLLYIDAFFIYKQFHYPHYMVVLGRKDKKVRILDPWDGKEKELSEKELLQGMLLLSEHLGFPPRAIITKRKGK